MNKKEEGGEGQYKKDTCFEHKQATVSDCPLSTFLLWDVNFPEKQYKADTKACSSFTSLIEQLQLKCQLPLKDV